MHTKAFVNGDGRGFGVKTHNEREERELLFSAMA